MDGPSVDPTKVFHLLWTGVITVLGGILGWNWNKLNEEVKDKASKEVVDQLIEANRVSQERQDEMHRENRDRLDNIYRLLANRSEK